MLRHELCYYKWQICCHLELYTVCNNSVIICLDIPLSYGLVEMKIHKKKLNCVEFVWDPQRDTGIYIKIHAISTEFTPRKHGGEKGVPFRLQVETYLNDEYDSRLLYAASCQVKVFKVRSRSLVNVCHIW